jgi:hypothetical protein
LAGNSQRLKKECREISPGPNAKTRDGDEWHKFLLANRLIVPQGVFGKSRVNGVRGEDWQSDFTWNCAQPVGRAPWSARVALDLLFATPNQPMRSLRGRPGGRPRTRGSALQ